MVAWNHYKTSGIKSVWKFSATDCSIKIEVLKVYFFYSNLKIEIHQL